MLSNQSVNSEQRRLLINSKNFYSQISELLLLSHPIICRQFPHSLSGSTANSLKLDSVKEKHKGTADGQVIAGTDQRRHSSPFTAHSGLAWPLPVHLTLRLLLWILRSCLALMWLLALTATWATPPCWQGRQLPMNSTSASVPDVIRTSFWLGIRLSDYWLLNSLGN